MQQNLFLRFKRKKFNYQTPCHTEKYSSTKYPSFKNGIFEMGILGISCHRHYKKPIIPLDDIDILCTTSKDTKQLLTHYMG